MATIIFIEVIWTLVCLLHLIGDVPFAAYLAVAIILFVIGVLIWDRLTSKKQAAEKKYKDEIVREYGYLATEEQIRQCKMDPRRRNQKRGRGPRNGNLDQSSCEICGAYTGDENAFSYFHTKYLCYDCEQRYKEAEKNGQLPYIAGYTDDERDGQSNRRQLWIDQQITAIDLMDGVIDEKTARAEIAASIKAGEQWVEQKKSARIREKRWQQEAQRDREQKKKLNDEVQRLLS